MLMNVIMQISELLMKLIVSCKKTDQWNLTKIMALTRNKLVFSQNI